MLGSTLPEFLFCLCMPDLNAPSGQGYCQGGFSAEFTKVSCFIPAEVMGMMVFSMYIGRDEGGREE